MFSTENKNYVEEYDRGLAQVMCNYTVEMNHRAAALPQGVSLGQQYVLPKGLKVYGDQARTAAYKEMDQLHKRSCVQTSPQT